MIIIPYILTLLTGFFSLKLILKDAEPYPVFFLAGLSALTGIAITIFLTFFSFAIYNSFNLVFLLFCHLALITGLFFAIKPHLTVCCPRPTAPTLVAAGAAGIAGALASAYASIYPMGGWDAWTLWNFKSRFLLLAGTRWKELFDPVLLRFHPHYPIGLPLFNAWTWSFQHGEAFFPPLINTVIFNILLAVLLTGMLQRHDSGSRAALPAAILFFSPVYLTFMTIQYCDILVSLFLAAALGMILEAHRTGNHRFFILSGIFIGTLSFLKIEGAVLAALIFAGAHFYIIKKPNAARSAASLWISAGLSALPTILFLTFLSPETQSFVNGLTSRFQPSTLSRLGVILSYMGREFFSPAWFFLWGAVLVTGTVYADRVFRRKFLIFPGVITAYLVIVILQYWINTYFPILWWLETSLRRILITLLPAVLLWMACGIFEKKAPGSKAGG